MTRWLDQIELIKEICDLVYFSIAISLVAIDGDQTIIFGGSQPKFVQKFEELQRSNIACCMLERSEENLFENIGRYAKKANNSIR